MIKSKVLNKIKMDANEISIQRADSSLSIDGLEDVLTTLWLKIKNDTLAQGIKIWDGLYYRVENLDELETSGKKLLLSTISYSRVRALIEYSKTNPLTLSQFPLHINTGAMVKSADNIFVFGKKDIHGKPSIDIVGGGLQEDELEVTLGHDLEKNILKEMHEEINVSKKHVSSARINGFILTSTMSLIIVFEIDLNITFSEIKELFELREEFEFSEIIGVEEESISNFLLAQHGRYISLIQALME